MSSDMRRLALSGTPRPCGTCRSTNLEPIQEAPERRIPRPITFFRLLSSDVDKISIDHIISMPSVNRRRSRTAAQAAHFNTTFFLPLLLLLSVSTFSEKAMAQTQVQTQTQEQTAGILSSLPELDVFRAANFEKAVRKGNVDVIALTPGNEAPETQVIPQDEVALCHLPYIFPFSSGNREPWNAIASYEGAFAIALAAHHLNSGNGSIVPEVAKLNERCNIRFTMEMHDTELAESIAVDQTIGLTDRERSKRLPCALLGAARSAVSIPTSIISGLRGYPQFSPISTSAALDDVAQYPLFGRTIPSDDGTAVPFVLYMRNVLNVKYLAVVNVDDAYGRAFSAGIQIAAQNYAPDMTIQSVDINPSADAQSIERVVKFLADTQYTFFFGILFPTELVDQVITEAHKQGIAGTGKHNWIFADATGGSVPGRDYERGSPLEKSFRGTSMLSAVGGIQGMEMYDQLTKGMRELNNADDMAYMRSIMPQYLSGEPVDHDSILTGDTFLSEPGLIAPFLYDATIALGLAACHISAGNVNGTYFDGKTHFDQVLANQFLGTSGDIVFQETGTRDPQSALFSLTNFVDDEELSTDATVQYKRVEASVFRSGEWEELVPYVFNDGTTTIPRDLPEITTERNYLSPGLRGLGLALCAIVVVLSICFAVWTHVKRREKVVRASQPIFLLTICIGTLIMGCSIIPLIIDMGITSQQGADAACISFPWLLAVGFSVVFSSLFTKTHRINKIFKNAASFKRVKISAWDVMKPMLALIGANILVLALWTGLSPSEYETITVSEDIFGRPTETYGICQSNNAVYVAVLGVLNAGVLVFSVYEAYSARSISTEFSESEYIFRILVLILLVSFIGIPVLIIARENSNAFVFVFAGIIFVICCSVLLLIFVPKYRAMKKAAQKAKDRQERKQDGSTSRLSSQSRLSSAESESEAEGIKIVTDTRAQKELEKENRRLRKEMQKYQANQARRLSMGSSCPALSVDNIKNDDSSAANGDEEEQRPVMNRRVSFSNMQIQEYIEDTEHTDNSITREDEEQSSEARTNGGRASFYDANFSDDC